MTRPKSREPLYSLEAIEREIAARRMGSGVATYSPHAPHPKQKEFLALNCFEAFYGGSAGGGKSDALLMAALQYVHVPHYSALILRRTYPDLALPGAIMDRAKEWLIPQGVRWNDTDKRFTFPSGAALTFGYLDTDADRFRYASAEFQFVGFDEVTHFPEAWFRFLFSRLRKRADIDVPLRMRAAGTPGGIGHHWAKRRFIDRVDPECAGIVFIPARLEDNPGVDAAGYVASLAHVDAVTRRQLLDGVWIADAGELVYRYREDRNDIRALPKWDRWNYVLGLDFGIKDATAYTVLAWRENDPNVYVVESWKERDKLPPEVSAAVLELGKRYPFTKIVGDVGGMGKVFEQDMRRRFSIPIEPAEKTNKRGFISLLNGALEQGLLLIAADKNEALVKELLELPWSDDTRQKEAPGFDNHLTDSLLYSWRACPNYNERMKSEAPAVGTDAYYKAEQERLEQLAEERFAANVGKEWWRQ